MRKWHGTHVNEPDGEWNKVAEMMLNGAGNGHPAFRAISALGGELKSKGCGKKSIHYNGSEETVGSDSSHGYFFQSVQYLRSTHRMMQRIRPRFKLYCK